jgi:hypothetical protein
MPIRACNCCQSNRIRYVSAFAVPLSSEHPHILELHIRPSSAARFLGCCLGFVPAFVSTWVKRIFPEWFIPSHVVLKAQKQPDRGEEQTVIELFDTEVKAYHRLKPVQGLVVPNLYGLCRYNGMRALILDHLSGLSLASPPRPGGQH